MARQQGAGGGGFGRFCCRFPDPGGAILPRSVERILVSAGTGRATRWRCDAQALDLSSAPTTCDIVSFFWLYSSAPPPPKGKVLCTRS